MAPLIVLLSVFISLSLAHFLFSRVNLPLELRGSISLAAVFIVTGLGHFLNPAPMVEMLPDLVPFRFEIILITGVLELLGAIGLLIPKTRKMTGIILILFLVGVLPANIYGSMQSVDLGGMACGVNYLYFRIPLQLFLIGWSYHFLEDHGYKRVYRFGGGLEAWENAGLEVHPSHEPVRNRNSALTCQDNSCTFNYK